MNLARPIRSVIPSLQGEVLAVLARSDQPLTGRTVAKLVGDAGSPAGVARVLKALVREGLVRATTLGSASLYELNREHLATDAIVSLSRLRETLIDRLAVAVDAMRPRPRTAYLFGSALRGDGDASSDIDLLLVRPRNVSDEPWDAAVAELADRIQSMTGNPAGIVVYDAVLDHGDPLVRTVVQEGLRLL